MLRQRLLLCCFILLGSWVWAGEGDYVGSAACTNCHQAQYQLWQQSDHRQSMAKATPESVLGDFSDVSVEFHGIKSRFFTEGATFFVETTAGQGERKRFEVQHTFGFYPLQQYLIETDNGHIQAFSIAWDSRKASEGGQRWFHLQPDEKINPEHPFFWTRHLQNWNARCSDCHSTNVGRGYDEKNNSYNTTWSEINVGCEACHGPAAQHVVLAEKSQLTKKQTGFDFRPKQPLQWQFEKDDPIANPVGQKNNDHIDQCGSCHSLRTQLSQSDITQDYHDKHVLQMPNEGSYFEDGQIREEVFVLGSFMQSKMHEKGVSCSNCHNPHSGKLLAPDNSLCSQCHSAQVFDTPKHHHHQRQSTGAACVNCHMPARTYMQVDDRRDHSFTIPRPDLSQKLGVPNACSGCHLKKDKAKGDQWAGDQLTGWGVENKSHWASVNHRAQQGDVTVTRPLTSLLDEEPLPALIRAGLLQQLALIPSRVGAEAAQKQLQSPEPLLRKAAVVAMEGLPAQMRWQLLSPYLNDVSRSVRFQLAETLADVLIQLPAGQKSALQELIDEYRESLSFSAGSPAVQVSVASLEVALNNVNAAERAYLQALKIEPHYIPALLNLADLYRSTGRDFKVEPLFAKALQIAPDSAAVQHGYGLFLVRQQSYPKALKHLALAVSQSNAQPRYAYVHAVALDGQGDTSQAIEVLITADKRWPNRYELLMTLVIYLDKTNDSARIYPYLSALSAIAPSSPEVKKMISKYSQ